MQFFDGVPVWHCTASMTSKYGRPTFISKMRGTDRVRLLAHAMSALEGVGVAGDDHISPGMVTIGIRRQATEEECRQADLTRMGELDNRHALKSQGRKGG